MRVQTRIARVSLPEPQFVKLQLILEKELNQDKENELIQNLVELVNSAEQVQDETTQAFYCIGDSGISLKRASILLCPTESFGAMFIGDLLSEFGQMPPGFAIRKRFSHENSCWEVYAEYILGDKDSRHSTYLRKIKENADRIRLQIVAYFGTLVSDYLQREQ